MLTRRQGSTGDPETHCNEKRKDNKRLRPVREVRLNA